MTRTCAVVDLAMVGSSLLLLSYSELPPPVLHSRVSFLAGHPGWLVCWLVTLAGHPGKDRAGKGVSSLASWQQLRYHR